MHGRLKIKTTAEKEAEERKVRTEKALKFKAGVQLVLSKRLQNDENSEVLKITSQLLSANPDVYTLWNIRREIILDHKTTVLNNIEQLKAELSDSNEIEIKLKNLENDFDTIGENELSLSETCLMKNPKSYSAWFQRRFILSNMFEPTLKRELLLCNDALMKDDRNFHCWDHRRYVSNLLQLPFHEEISFTKDKIDANFSNFSSWYYRSCLITQALIMNTIKITDIWDDEYEMVENAIFTDPIDQSAWFYHRWLTLTDFDHLETKSARKHHKISIQKLLIDFTSGIILVMMNRPISCFPQSIIVSCVKGDGQKSVIELTKVNNYVSSTWFNYFTPGSDVVIQMNYSDGIISIPFTDNAIVIKSFQQKQSLCSNRIVLSEEKKSNLIELKEMEPNNKWVNLAFACCVEPEGMKQIETFRKLCDIDPWKTNYYKDMMSKLTLESKVKDFDHSINCNLVKLDISCLYFTNQLIHLRSLDLSKNQLKKLSSKLNDLVSLKILVADDNLIDTVDPNFKMLSLESLSLKRNKLKNLNQITTVCKQSHRLVKLYIAGNSFLDQAEGDVNPKLAWEDEPISNLASTNDPQIIHV